VQRVTKYQKWRIKRDRYFLNEVETQLREKPLPGSQAQEFHYSKDKASYKAVALTEPLMQWSYLELGCVTHHERLPTKSPT